MPQIPFFIRLKALFAQNEHEFWWNQFTDDELELRMMNASQLASELNKAQVSSNHERKILVEHMLSVRLAQLQSRASWGSGALGFGGAVVGAAMTVGLTMAQTPAAPEAKVTVKCEFQSDDATSIRTGSSSIAVPAFVNTPPQGK
jgi:hypothetical protein